MDRIEDGYSVWSDLFFVILPIEPHSLVSSSHCARSFTAGFRPNLAVPPFRLHATNRERFTRSPGFYEAWNAETDISGRYGKAGGNIC